MIKIGIVVFFIVLVCDFFNILIIFVVIIVIVIIELIVIDLIKKGFICFLVLIIGLVYVMIFIFFLGY